MTPFRQGDILLVPFPFTDQTAAKQRPAVVLSSETYNRVHRDLILAPVTSRIPGGTHEVFLTDWEVAGLLKPSAVKPILTSLETTLIRRRLGFLSDSDLREVRAMLRLVFDLN